MQGVTLLFLREACYISLTRVSEVSMHIPHTFISYCLTGDPDIPIQNANLDDSILNDPVWIEHIQSLLGLPQERRRTMIEWLKTLPDGVQVQKIGLSLSGLAASRNCALPEDLLAWWDIMSDGSHHLLGWLLRESRWIRVHFIWKKALHLSPEEVRSQRLSMHSSWTRDAGIPDGWQFELEAVAWEALKLEFERWLSAPLPLLPSGQPFIPSLDTVPPATVSLAADALHEKAAE